MFRERCWYEWAQRGLTRDDLEFVIRKLRADIATGDRRPGALKFTNLIQSADLFEEDLALYRAKSRGAPSREQQARASVLRATGRPSPDLPGDARPAGAIVEDITAQLAALHRAVEEA